jgi:hypothetical protein
MGGFNSQTRFVLDTSKAPIGSSKALGGFHSPGRGLKDIFLVRPPYLSPSEELKSSIEETRSARDMVGKVGEAMVQAEVGFK